MPSMMFLRILSLVILYGNANAKCSCDPSLGFIQLTETLCFQIIKDGNGFPFSVSHAFPYINIKEITTTDIDGNSYFVFNEEEQTYEASNKATFGGILIIDNGLSVLFDTGLGQVDPLIEVVGNTLYQHLESVNCLDIDVVVNSHLHYDHTGWNIKNGYRSSDSDASSNAGDDKEDMIDRYIPTFDHPTVYYVQNDEYQFWKEYTLDDTDDISVKASKQTYETHVKTLVESGQMALRFGDYFISKNIELKRCVGHTPGHQCVYLYDDNGELSIMFLADAFHIPFQVCKPNANSVWDMGGEKTAQTRRRLVNEAYDHNAIFAPIHFPGLGRIKKCEKCNSESGFVWVPMTEQEVKQWGHNVYDQNVKTEI